MRQDQDPNVRTGLRSNSDHHDQSHSQFLESLVQTLLSEADTPPKEVNGVSDEFLAGMSIYLRCFSAPLQTFSHYLRRVRQQVA